MTQISTTPDVVTLINVFTVEPEHQQKVVDMLVRATETTMRHRPGFVSANIHRSLDGTRVANYAQWRSREAFEAIFADPEVTAHMQDIVRWATFDAHVYEVCFVDASS